MSISLYELSTGYKHLMTMLEETDDPVLVETLLKATNDQIQTKAVNIGKVTVCLDTTAELIKGEIDRLTKRYNTIKNKSQWLKDYMLRELEQMEIDNIDDPILPIKLVNNPPSVEITDEKVIPAKYAQQKITTTYSKKDMAADLKAGVEVPGATLKQTKRIKIG